MRSCFLALLLASGCHRQPPESHATSAPSSSASAVASVEAPVVADAAAPAPRAQCAEPQTLTQLKTHRPTVAWHGDQLVAEGRLLDPETFDDQGANGPTEHRVGDGRIETRPGAVVRVDASGAVKWSAPLAKGESLRSAGERWVVVETTIATESAFESEGHEVRVIDATTGKPHAGLYDDVAGGRAVREQMGSGKVYELPSGKLVFDSGPCAAGGMWGYTLTDRWLVCTANRSGIRLWDLQHANRERGLGEGVSMSPNDAYAIAVPTIGWGTGEPTRANVAHVDLDTGRETVVLKDPPSLLVDGGQAESVPVAFCGAGQLFALLGKRELAVYRGSDGARLAGAGAMFGGTIAFSASGRYVVQSRGGASTVYRLDP